VLDKQVIATTEFEILHFVTNDIFFKKTIKYRTALRNPPYPPFSKGGIKKKILLPPLKKGGRGDFLQFYFHKSLLNYVISI